MTSLSAQVCLSIADETKLKASWHQPGTKWWGPHHDNGSVEALSAGWLKHGLSQSGPVPKFKL